MSHMGTSLLLGVDGGGTKTVALVADRAGRVLGAARGPGSNWTGEDPSQPMAVVAETVRAALGQAGVTSASVGVFTLGGADWPEDHTRREAILIRTGLSGRVVVMNDAFAALRAGTRRPYGIALVAGTERNAAAISPDGRSLALGYYARYGGARSLTADALVAVTDAEAGLGRSTALTAALLAHFGLTSVDELYKAWLAGRLAEADQLRLSATIFAIAAAGDVVAGSLLVRQGEMFARYASALACRLGMLDLACEVVVSGGFFRGASPLLIDTLARDLAASLPRAELVRPRLEPAFGSLMLAFDAAGLAVTSAARENLAVTGPGPAFFATEDGRGYRPMSGAARASG